MKTSAVISFLSFFVLLSGCTQLASLMSNSFELQAMSRSDAKVYQGIAQQTGNGQGAISITIEDVAYNGRYSMTGSEQYTSFVNAYAQNNIGSSAHISGSGAVDGNNVTFMALLTARSGEGMRCAISGVRSGTGGGICVDTKNNVYDVIYRRSAN